MHQTRTLLFRRFAVPALQPLLASEHCRSPLPQVVAAFGRWEMAQVCPPPKTTKSLTSGALPLEQPALRVRVQETSPPPPLCFPTPKRLRGPPNRPGRSTTGAERPALLLPLRLSPPRPRHDRRVSMCACTFEPSAVSSGALRRASGPGRHRNQQRAGVPQWSAKSSASRRRGFRRATEVCPFCAQRDGEAERL